MDIEDIDSWYQEEKEKVYDEYMLKTEEKFGDALAKTKYKLQMKKLRAKYFKFYDQAVAKNKRKDKTTKKIEKIKKEIFKKIPMLKHEK
jgi:hypothetical protein